jgi:hypothetical protein
VPLRRIERLGGADELSPALVLGRAPALLPLGLHPALGGQHLEQLRERPITPARIDPRAVII